MAQSRVVPTATTSSGNGFAATCQERVSAHSVLGGWIADPPAGPGAMKVQKETRDGDGLMHSPHWLPGSSPEEFVSSRLCAGITLQEPS